MKQNGVDVSNIEYCDEATGIAKIIVEENGQNRILVVPGANYEVDKLYIDKHLEVIKNSDIVVTQLEIPLETVKYTLQKAKEFGKITVLNPAPATKLDEDIISNSDYIIPNETELELLSGASITDENSVIEASKILLNKGVKGLIVTLGSKGCIFISKNEVKSFSAYKVKAIDTTAAGDSFIGGFINGLASGLNFDEAIDRGTKVAAISVTRIGAQTSIPTFEEVLNFKESII
jgi:ribokinase